MTEPAPAAIGSVHDLDEHRATRTGETVSLVKAPADDAPLEGTIVPADQPLPAQQPAAVVRTVRVVHGVRQVVTHDRTRSSLRLLARHGSYTAAGAGILAKRAWDSRSTARYERMMRAAETAGDHETAKEWEQRAAAFRAARHQRRMDLLKAPERIAKGAAIGAGVGAGSLLALGVVMAIAQKDPALVGAPFMATIETVNWIIFIATVMWGPLAAIGPWLLLLGLWNVGRKHQAAPTWAMPAGQRSTDGEPITPSIVVTALRDLGIPALRRAIKDMGDAGASMLSPIALAGCGVELDATLPSGASTDEVMNRRRKLAENLGRHEHEVHLSVAPAARTVRMWIADSGALDEPVPASPLVVDPDLRADYKSGRAPWGLDLRGDLAGLSLYQKHLLITGLSNQGKTASLRALALWLALDKTVEFRIGDLKGVGDWSMFEGLATMLIEGPTDEHVMQVTHMAEGVFAEMERRLLAPKGTVFPPLVLVVDEAQVAYGSAAVGDDKRPYGGAKATSRYFRAVKGIHDQGRAVNVTIWEGTQDPTDQNLPKRSREGNHIRAALVLGTESQAKMALGETPVDKGAAPHKLRLGFDKGQVVVAGEGLKLPAGQSSMNVRTHFIDDDEAEEIAQRAKALRAGVETRTTDVPDDEIDHLADIADAIGDQAKMRTQEVLQRLAEANPRTYREWTFASLTAVLEGTGAEPYKTSGIMHISRDRVLQALAARDENTLDRDSA
jgi:S-DNA-T family DNA segregation ATPase FtsK/SpoIIIE